MSNLLNFGHKQHTENYKIGIREYKMNRIIGESESNVFDEVESNERNDCRVKYEPCKTKVFSESEKYNGSSERDLIDHRNASVLSEKQEGITCGTVELNIDAVDLSESSTNECNEEQIKIEGDIDIHYEDVKTEIVEKKPGECEMCRKHVGSETNFASNSTGYCCHHHQGVSNFNSIRGEDMTQDVKPSLLCRSTDFGQRLLNIQEETFSGNEASSAIIQRDSEVGKKKYRKKTLVVILEEHQMSVMPKEKLVRNINPKSANHSSRSKSIDRNHTVENEFRGKICPKGFTRPSSLKRHERTHKGEKPFRCKICFNTLTSNNLKKHEFTHTSEKPYRCKICYKAFTHMYNMKRHERLHTGDTPYKCMICSKAFTDSGDLKKHERTHTGEKPFHCKFCSKAFTASNNCKRHERTHTGEKPFNCKICSKAFSVSGVLKKHERTHTGEKPFHCKFCSKAFTSSSNIKRHERTHTGEKPFHCKICYKAFSVLAVLKTHERIHTGEKPFNCKICPKAFTISNNLKRHEMIHRKIC